MLDVGCPWILLLPLHNIAYIGILGNVSRMENGVEDDLDLSLWYVIVWVFVLGSGIWMVKDYGFISVTSFVFSLFLVYIVGAQIHYNLFKMFSRHPLLVTLIWFLPLVTLWQALVAERRLKEECTEFVNSDNTRLV